MGQTPQQFTPNEQMSLQDRLEYILGSLEHRRDELAAVLPPDITFEAFHATINQAIRANPDLLEATSRSLINACVKAAYDGLRIDGREAAITVDNVWVKVPGKPDRKEKQARYMPMYQGLCQQLYRGGMVLSCEAHVIHRNDAYDLEPTREPPIMHRPLIVDKDGNPVSAADRGPPVLVYNIARLKSGARTFAWMTSAEVRDVQKESKSGWDEKNQCSKGVWKKWEGEQWKKTVLRRHRKTLPVGLTPIRDMEASEEFPQFDRTAPDPRLAAAPPRPTRAALQQHPGGNGIPLDLGGGGGFGGEEGELIEAGQNDRRDEPREQRQSQRQDHQQDRQRDEPRVEIPEDERAWAVWGVETERAIEAAADMDKLIALQAEIDPVLAEASKAIKDRITGKLTDRAADIAAGSDDGAAAGDSGNGTAAGDRK